jgi:hypothetical protein
VQEAQSAPTLAEAARGLGMIPTRDTAHLVKDPAGNWVVVGTPKPAQGVPPPPLNTKLPDEKPLPPVASTGNPIEVPSLVLPGNGAPPVLLAPGPDVMVRTPDGAITMGPQHLPAPGAPLPMPGAGPVPVPEMPIAPGSIPVVPVPPSAVAPVLPAPPAAAPLAPVPLAGPVPPPAVDVPGAPHHVGTVAPMNGEQFGPLTVTAPGAAR